jgi:Heterokaryon incompatibility protein (HET)
MNDVPTGSYVIDVLQGCIVSMTHECRYVALSYVWGATRQLQLTEATFEVLNKAGTMHRRDLDIPGTIRDALWLFKNIDENNLWVDSLCIIQDRADHRDAQIKQMGIVYSQATSTIVAAAGSDADHGLPGVGKLRAVGHKRARIQGLSLITAHRSTFSAIEQSKWNTRAWTFQESVLSTRKLVFTEKALSFRCTAATYIEDIVLEQHLGLDAIQWHSQYPPVDWSSYIIGKHEAAAFYEYLSVVGQFVRREVTYENDFINALQGVTDRYNITMEGFFWGLPLQSLGDFLL